MTDTNRMRSIMVDNGNGDIVHLDIIQEIGVLFLLRNRESGDQSWFRKSYFYGTNSSGKIDDYNKLSNVRLYKVSKDLPDVANVDQLKVLALV